MFKELNRYARTIKEGINTEDMEFKPLKEFVGKQIRVDGFFFNTGKFGKQVVVVGAGYLINMPERAVEQFEEIANNEVLLQGVLDGKLMLTDLKMIDTKNGTTVAYTFEDC